MNSHNPRCPKCSFPNADHAGYCEQCGTPLVSAMSVPKSLQGAGIIGALMGIGAWIVTGFFFNLRFLTINPGVGPAPPSPAAAFWQNLAVVAALLAGILVVLTRRKKRVTVASTFMMTFLIGMAGGYGICAAAYSSALH
jgi:tellurite resistance protein TehA-like permease